MHHHSLCVLELSQGGRQFAILPRENGQFVVQLQQFVLKSLIPFAAFFTKQKEAPG